jgi:hypothetical protein
MRLPEITNGSAERLQKSHGDSPSTGFEAILSTPRCHLKRSAERTRKQPVRFGSRFTCSSASDSFNIAVPISATERIGNLFIMGVRWREIIPAVQ